MTTVSRNSPLPDFQEQNGRIYSVGNDRNYDNMGILSKMHEHVIRVLKGVRKFQNDDLEYQLCMSLSWALAMANRWHFDIDRKMWKFFPGICPYCLVATCKCDKLPKGRPRKRHKVLPKPKIKKPITLQEWQAMFAVIYPNTIKDAATHLGEETGEVSQCIRIYQATHRAQWFNKTIEELIDVVTNIFAVANCMKFNLARGMEYYFANSCPRCHKLPSKCKYSIEDRVIHIPKNFV